MHLVSFQLLVWNLRGRCRMIDGFTYIINVYQHKSCQLYVHPRPMRESLSIPKRYSESVYRSRTDNAMTKRHKMIYKTLHRKIRSDNELLVDSRDYGHKL